MRCSVQMDGQPYLPSASNETDYYYFLVKSKSLTCFLAVGAGPRV